MGHKTSWTCLLTSSRSSLLQETNTIKPKLLELVEMAPNLRNLLQRKVVTQISTGIGLGIVSAVAWKVGYADPKRRKYEAYYKDFDADAEARKMEARLAAAGK